MYSHRYLSRNVSRTKKFLSFSCHLLDPVRLSLYLLSQGPFICVMLLTCAVTLNISFFVCYITLKFRIYLLLKGTEVIIHLFLCVCCLLSSLCKKCTKIMLWFSVSPIIHVDFTDIMCNFV